MTRHVAILLEPGPIALALKQVLNLFETGAVIYEKPVEMMDAIAHQKVLGVITITPKREDSTLYLSTLFKQARSTAVTPPVINFEHNLNLVSLLVAIERLNNKQGD
jgi:hypothetical protein